MWGIIPAAGQGTRIQPLAFSKELLPIGSRVDERGVERPRAVSEYLVERMVRGGADKICFVISPWKSDILQYYGGSLGDTAFAYVVQNHATGLCDAIFRALPLIGPDEPVLLGLPDTVWFPADALAALPDDRLTFLLFPVTQPSLFDAVLTGRGWPGDRDRGEGGRTPHALDLGRVQAAGRHAAPAARVLDRAGAAGPVHRHAGQRLSRGRRRGLGRARPASVMWMSARCTATARRCARWTGRLPMAPLRARCITPKVRFWRDRRRRRDWRDHDGMTIVGLKTASASAAARSGRGSTIWS